MRTVSTIIAFILFISCRQEKTTNSSFGQIDLTFSNGWTKTVSIYIDSTKIIKVRIDSLNTVSNYKDTLLDSTFYKITLLVDHILKTKHDSLINRPVPDGGGYSLILTSKINNINTVVFNDGSGYKPLDTLVFKLLKLADNIKNNSLDTTFKFKSYSRIGAPPPMIDNVKFVPPILKDDEIVK